MRVYLSGSARAMDNDLPFLRKIVQVVNASKSTITRNWIESAHRRGLQGVPDEEADWGSIYLENVDAMKQSDAAIIESTQNRFSQGFWVYSAIRHKLPTLMVTRNPKHLELYRFTNKYITVKLYSNEKELEKIVTKFLKTHGSNTKDTRFNFLIDRQIYSFLREESYKTGKNKSEIIRQLLEEEIEKRY